MFQRKNLKNRLRFQGLQFRLSSNQQGFIQTLTDLRLPEVKQSKLNLKLSFETQHFKPKNKKAYNKNFLERALFILFLPLGASTASLKQGKITIQRTKHVCTTDVFFYYISSNWNYGTDFPNNPHSKQDFQPLRQWRSWTKA